MADWNAILEEIAEGKTQQVLGEHLGYSQPHITRLLNGQSTITSEVKRRIVQKYPEYLAELMWELLADKEAV